VTDFSFVHFTDTHVMAGATYGPTQLDTAATLRQVVGVLNALEPRPAFGVVGGDLCSPDLIDRTRAVPDEEYEPSYRLLREILGEVAFPTHLLLGNHDRRGPFHRVMGTGAPSDGAPHHWSFAYGGYRFVALDSLAPGQHWGEVGADQLAWLRTELATYRGQPTFVFVHHHPWLIGVDWMDRMPLRNGDDLVATLREYPDARWIVCGHVHLDTEAQRDGVTMWTSPSTCFQVSKLSPTRKIFPGPPGFRLFTVSGDTVRTRVLHVPPDGLAGL
jgi:3',5'-cyclic AMP phosphodiesterase CpdA